MQTDDLMSKGRCKIAAFLSSQDDFLSHHLQAAGHNLPSQPTGQEEAGGRVGRQEGRWAGGQTRGQAGSNHPAKEFLLWKSII